jgi:hypothetical protein
MDEKSFFFILREKCMAEDMMHESRQDRMQGREGIFIDHRYEYSMPPVPFIVYLGLRVKYCSIIAVARIVFAFIDRLARWVRGIFPSSYSKVNYRHIPDESRLNHLSFV